MIDSSQKIKRLLAFCYEFPPIGGGAGNALFHLCKEWVKQDIDVAVITSSPGKTRITEKMDGIHVTRLNVGRKAVSRGRVREMIRYMALSVAEGIKACRADKPDLCVAFMAIPSGLAPWVLSKKFGIPYATELRGGDVPGFDPKHLWLYHLILKSFIKRIWSQSDCLIANGSGLKELASRHRKSTVPIQVIPNGVDFDFFKPNTEGTHKNSLRTVIAVGRLKDSQKNFSEMIEIFSETPNWNLEIVGDGPDKSKLQRKAENLNAHNIRFVGWKNKEDLLYRYRKSDCYISTSRYEGMPNTALEAMATGLPLILSDIGGHQELADAANGMLFRRGACRQIIDFLKTCEQKPEILRRMSVASRKKALEKFSWKDIADERIKWYEFALGRKTGIK